MVNSSASVPNLSTADLLISGIPEQVAETLAPLEMSHKVFDALNLASLKNDILNVRLFKKSKALIEKKNIDKPKMTSCIISLKTSEIRDHIIDVKRRVRDLLIKNTFSMVPNLNMDGRIYVNEFLHSDVHKLLIQTKDNAKALNYKYVWVRKGVIYVKNDDRTNKIIINSVCDLNNLQQQLNDQTSTKLTSLRILSLIIHSYLNHIAQIKDLVAEVKLHVIFLAETWLRPTVGNNIFSLEDYTVIRRDRGLLRDDKDCYVRGGELACIVHKSFEVKALHVSAPTELNQPEYIIADVTLTTGVHLLLYCIYRRPKENLLFDFFNIYSKFAPNFKNSIIVGDLNCDLLKSDSASNHLKLFISKSSLYCILYKGYLP